MLACLNSDVLINICFLAFNDSPGNNNRDVGSVCSSDFIMFQPLAYLLALFAIPVAYLLYLVVVYDITHPLHFIAGPPRRSYLQNQLKPVLKWASIYTYAYGCMLIWYPVPQSPSESMSSMSRDMVVQSTFREWDRLDYL